MFPVLFAATALGICNFVTRIFTGISPILAQMDEPFPMVIFAFLSLVGVNIVWFIQRQDGATEGDQEIQMPKLLEIDPKKLKKKNFELSKPE